MVHDDVCECPHIGGVVSSERAVLLHFHVGLRLPRVLQIVNVSLGIFRQGDIDQMAVLGDQHATRMKNELAYAILGFRETPLTDPLGVDVCAPSRASRHA